MGKGKGLAVAEGSVLQQLSAGSQPGDHGRLRAPAAFSREAAWQALAQGAGLWAGLQAEAAFGGETAWHALAYGAGQGAALGTEGSELQLLLVLSALA